MELVFLHPSTLAGTLLGLRDHMLLVSSVGYGVSSSDERLIDLLISICDVNVIKNINDFSNYSIHDIKNIKSLTTLVKKQNALPKYCHNI